MNPETIVHMDENSFMEMDTVQIKGVDSTIRKTSADLKEGAKLVVMERLMTPWKNRRQRAILTYLWTVKIQGQTWFPALWQEILPISFLSPILLEIPSVTVTRNVTPLLWMRQRSAQVPELTANSTEAALIHEAAIGKICGRADYKADDAGADRRGSGRADCKRIFEIKEENKQEPLKGTILTAALFLFCRFAVLKAARKVYYNRKEKEKWKQQKIVWEQSLCSLF